MKKVILFHAQKKKNTYRARHTFVLLSIHIVTLGTAYTSEKKKRENRDKA